MSRLRHRWFEAVLFDLDGTLIDSTPAILRCWLRWAKEEGIDPERLEHAHGVPAEQIVARLVPPARRPAALQRITALEIADTDDITALPGAHEALAALPRDRAAIATSCTRDLGEARLAASGLPRPEVVVTFDDVMAGKPAPDPFLRAAELLGVDPHACLVVEDAPSGVAAARAAGCAVLTVTTTTAGDRLDADLVVPDLAAVQWLVGDDGIGVRPSTTHDAPSSTAARPSARE